MQPCYLNKVGKKVAFKSYSVAFINSYGPTYDFISGMNKVICYINDKKLLDEKIKIGDVCNVFGTLTSSTPILFPADQSVIGHDFFIELERVEVVSGSLKGYEII